MSVPGDTYSSIAKELEMDPSRLMAYNDVAEDREVMPWQEVYLQPKLDYAPKEMTSITIGEEDCIFSIAQRLGMTLDALRKLNPKAADIPGTTLKLR
jgi:spore germination protein YaaH